MTLGTIHPTAVIHPNAQLAPGVHVGPYAVIDAGVQLAEGCVVGPHVHLTGHTVIGRENHFHTGCVIGDAPQDLKYKDQPTWLEIGHRNVFREHVTVHRSNRIEESTLIGDGNFLMAGSHVGHNARMGSHNILANGALLGGHVEVANQAFLSGNCLVHQFCRIGRLALMQGGSAISKDLPPFCVARGDNGICGLNVVGLRRARVTSGERLELQRAYHLLFRTLGRRRAAAEQVRDRFPGNLLVQELARFALETKRGLCDDVGRTKPENHSEGEALD